ncbi:MAG TPA: FtsQ-type POTRA domain-containing protein [Candidatus Polarisedimenticolaceae bacterium]|nr:FtsQ-type POTRA domain-containing protein [Candidatus Polarisedimenticolaceae bacterium]
MILPDEARPPFGPDRRYWRRRANRQVRKERRTRAAVRLLGVGGLHLGLIGLVLLGAGRAWSHLSTSPSFDLREIVVHGTERTTPAAVHAALTPLRGRNLVALHLEDVQELLAPNPWVARASIRRILPHVLRVDVEERVPTAVAILDGQAMAVDAEGVVIGPCGPGLADDLPVLNGLASLPREQRTAALARGVEAVVRLRRTASAFAGAVSELDLERPDRIAVLTAAPGPRLLLDPQRVERNLDRYLALRDELTRRAGDALYVDLRWSDRIALLPAPQKTLDPQERR